MYIFIPIYVDNKLQKKRIYIFAISSGYFGVIYTNNFRSVPSTKTL